MWEGGRGVAGEVRGMPSLGPFGGALCPCCRGGIALDIHGDATAREPSLMDNGWTVPQSWS